MKRLTLFLLLLSSTFIFSQNSNQLQKDGIPYRVGDKWGYMNHETKEIMISPQYDSITHPPYHSYDNIKFYVDNKKGLLYYGTTEEGAFFQGELISAHYKSIDSYINGYRVESFDSKYGYINHNGTIILDPIYRWFKIYYKKDGKGNKLNDFYFIVYGEGEFSDGVLDATGKNYLVEPVYNISNIFGYDISEELDDKIGTKYYHFLLIDKNGKNYILDKNFNLISIKTAKELVLPMAEHPNALDYSKYSNVTTLHKKITSSSSQCDEYVKTNKTYKTKDKIKYRLTNNCYNDYRIITSLDQNNGLMEVNSTDFKNPILAPYYDISYVKYNNQIIFIIKDMRAGLPTSNLIGFYIPKSDDKEPLFIEPQYSSYRTTQDFIELTNDKQENDYLFISKNYQFLDINAKDIKILNKYKNNSFRLYKTTITSDLYYYIGSDGFPYYTES